MISRHNILELTNQLGTGAFHSALLTCFTFDPIFFYEIHLPILRKLGITNVVVMMDAGQYDLMMENANLYAYKFDGYTLLRQTTSSGTGVFHSKIHLLLGEKRGAIFLGSGNLTHSGMALNDEVWAELYYDEERKDALPLFMRIWKYLTSLPANDLSKTQTSWMLEATPWLNESISNEKIIVSPNINGRSISFIANTQEQSIGAAIKERIGSEEVESLTVVSPFYDDDAYSIAKLFEDNKVGDITFFVDTQNGRVPRKCMEGTKVYDWNLKGRDSRQKLHAKTVQVITRDTTYLVMGSANATRNALGLNKNGYNDETCLIIKDTEARDYIEELGIKPSETSLSIERLAEASNNQLKKERLHKPIYSILWCKLEDSILSTQLQKVADMEEGVKISLNNNKGEEICSLPYAVSVKLDDDCHPAWVTLSKDGHTVSNACLVQDDEVVMKYHPNERNRKLMRFLDKDSPWENNLGAILQYLSFDNPDEIAIKHDRVSSNNTTKARVVEVDKELFDLTPIAIKSRMSANTNLQLVEFLSTVFNQGRKNDVQSDLTEKEQEDEDNVRSSKKEPINTDRYATQVNRLLQNIIQHCSNALPKISDDSRKWLKERHANQNEYSALVCGVYLSLLDKSDGCTPIKNRKRLLMQSISLACLTFIDGWDYNDEYRKGKMKSMLRIFCGRALLALVHYTWSKEQESAMELLALNLFNQYNHIADENHIAKDLIAETLTSLLKDSERNGLYISDKSLLLLQQTLNRYIVYLEKNENERRVRYQEIAQDNYIFVKGIGFCSFQKGKINTLGYYEYTFNYPFCDIKFAPRPTSSTITTI